MPTPASIFRHARLFSGAAGALAFAAAMAGCGPSYPNCNEDTDCHEGEFCVNGTCQMCRDDQDCAAGQQCVAGRCDPIPGYCTGSGECGAGEECVDNRCVPQQQSVVPEPTPSEPTQAMCELEPVYFDYDSSALADSSRDSLSQNAQCIQERGYNGVHLTGMTDPRGTEEYNLALGDRRARSAEKYLKSLGVESKISTSSMGEEMAQGSDEPGWAKDRRVEVRPQ